MKPIEFKEQNTIFAENQSEYEMLPAFKADTSQGEVVSCWKLSIKERLRLLWSGKLWMSLVTYNNPLQASILSTQKSDVLYKSKECKCIVCGCTDSKSCPGLCIWIWTDRKKGTGLCSRCKNKN